ncbi:DMT family transporter [Bacillus infantis]|uniref:DMT family transporter n=1 Tax=Bacillus infantis TaxID=324767 RepID=UPI003CE9BBFB
MMQGNRILSLWYALLAIAFWGVSFVSVKWLVDYLAPGALVSMRFMIAAIFLGCLLIIFKGSFYIKKEHFAHVFILSVLGVFIHQMVQASAMLTLDASAAGWMISFTPVFTSLLSFLFLSEKLSLLKIVGMIIAITGVLAISAENSGGTLQFSPGLGYFLLLFSTFNWAVYSILSKKFALPYSSLAVTFWKSLIGCLATLPFLLRNRGYELLYTLPLDGWLHLLFLGIFVSALGYWYWGKALEVLEATQVSVMMYLEPLFTLLAAILILGEKIPLYSSIGGALIILGVSAVNKPVLDFLVKKLFKYPVK